MHQNRFFQGSAPNPSGEAYSALPAPLAGVEGLAAASREPNPRASSFRPSGLAGSSLHFLNRGYAYDCYVKCGWSIQCWCM